MLFGQRQSPPAKERPTNPLAGIKYDRNQQVAMMLNHTEATCPIPSIPPDDPPTFLIRAVFSVVPSNAQGHVHRYSKGQRTHVVSFRYHEPPPVPTSSHVRSQCINDYFKPRIIGSISLDQGKVNNSVVNPHLGLSITPGGALRHDLPTRWSSRGRRHPDIASRSHLRVVSDEQARPRSVLWIHSVKDAPWLNKALDLTGALNAPIFALVRCVPDPPPSSRGSLKPRLNCIHANRP